MTLAISASNEERGIDRTLEALGRLDYPAERLFVVLVNDGSDDSTGDHLRRWTAGRPRTLVLDLEHRLGKPRAIRCGIEAAPASDLVAVCDADVRPRSDYLRRLAVPFADESVGAVAGYLSPENSRVSPIARYASVEAWVHQLITSAAKDRLDLNPPTLGGAAVYRRAALEQIGWFGTALSGDDIRASVALTRAGWRTRFVSDAVADNPVVHRWSDYWHQHVRWARDIFETASSPAAPVRIPLARRLEVAMLSAGYVDRVAFLAALVLAGIGHLTIWLPTAYLCLLAVEVAAAVAKAGAASDLLPYLGCTLIFSAFDIAASLAATFAHVTRRPRTPRSVSRPAAG